MSTLTLPRPRTAADATAPPPYDGPPARGRLARTWRGRDTDPRWARPALLGLLALTALLYLWDLGASGYANSFYAAAAQAGSVSWKAWFFGSLDSGNAITVDKPPAALWAMGLSGRIFGFSSWSLLVPQALEGVAAVALLHAAVRRVSGHVAGLLAGATLALTPAAVLMFRFDNPDAMLVLVLVAAAYCVVRALEHAGTRWLLGAGGLVGLAFLTKMGQGLLVVPAFGLAYLVAAPAGLGRRVAQLFGSLVAMYAVAGAYIGAVALWPVGSRPYIGGSGDNTVLGLALGYNGLGRLFGGSGNGGGGGGGGGMGGNSGFGGTPGLGRLFRDEMGYEISWLLPAALISLVVGLWLTRRAPRTDRTRASLLLWGGWLLVTGYTFSTMEGTIHPYYTVALAPAIAALVAVTGRLLWQQRDTWTARASAAVLVAVTADWSSVLLGRSGSHGTLRALVLVLGVATVAALLLRPAGVRRAAAAVALAAVLVTGVASASYGVSTAGTPHTGSIPTAVSTSGGAGGGMGGAGGGDGTTADAALVTLLQATTTRWAAAASGSMSAAPYQLASGRAVMAIGGFNGSDAAPTLAQFQAYVASGQVGYYLSGGGMGGGGGAGGSSDIATWVAAHYTATTVGGTTVYDLRVAAS